LRGGITEEVEAGKSGVTFNTIVKICHRWICVIIGDSIECCFIISDENYRGLAFPQREVSLPKEPLKIIGYAFLDFSIETSELVSISSYDHYVCVVTHPQEVTQGDFEIPLSSGQGAL